MKFISSYMVCIYATNVKHSKISHQICIFLMYIYTQFPRPSHIHELAALAVYS